MKMPTWINALTDQSRLLGESRVFRDGQPVTLTGTAEVVRRFLEHLARIRKTQEWAAQAMGLPVVRLNAVIHGRTLSETVVRAMDKWLEIQLQGERPAGFIKTGVAEQIFAAAKCGLQHGGIVFVHGPAGIGKTYSARAVQAETPGSIYVSIRTAGQTAAAVLESIADALRLEETRTRARLFAAIEGVLRDTGRLLIVDEIHKLAGRRNDEALHCLRDLHDAAGIPMLWLGMSNLAEYIHRGHARGLEPLDQLYSRIGLWLDLTEQAQRPDGRGLATIDEIRAMIAARQLRITPDGEEYLLMLAREIGAGAYRSVDKLLQFAAKYAGGREIDAGMLRGIQTARLGIRPAQSLDQRIMTRIQKVGA